VLVIDTATDTILTTIPNASLAESIGVAVTPDGSKAYVANLLQEPDISDCFVSVIDTATNTVINAIQATTNNCLTTLAGGGTTAFGKFIQPVPTFAGTPGSPNCTGTSIAAINRKYGSIAAAANALGASLSVLKASISEFCS
jgi:YVTN family beta-propeller protein